MTNSESNNSLNSQLAGFQAGFSNLSKALEDNDSEVEITPEELAELNNESGDGDWGLEAMSLEELRDLAEEVGATPTGDKRLKSTWINAIKE